MKIKAFTYGKCQLQVFVKKAVPLVMLPIRIVEDNMGKPRSILRFASPGGNIITNE